MSILVLAGCLAAQPAAKSATPARPDFSKVPGVIIDHIPASTGVYIGSPGLAILPNGDYVASHDHFGPKSTRNHTAVFRSRDRGQTWSRIGGMTNQYWSTLFLHQGALYLLGTTSEKYENMVIRRSTDGGETWTTPVDSRTGLLGADGGYHCAPQPVVVHNGRVWRAMEDNGAGGGWGPHFRAFIMSAPTDANLLDAANWTVSNRLPGDTKTWLEGKFNGWLEGNAVVTPDGEVVNILRVDTRSGTEKAAIVRISPDGRNASFDPTTGFVDFLGGAKKFTIRFDPISRLYWTLATIVHERHQDQGKAGGIRNTLALTCSPNLTNWTVRTILLYHPDVARHGFQYVEWLFDGEDLVAACRTACDDGLGGAHNAHDANFLTFHRIAGFRKLSLKDSVRLPDIAGIRYETPDLVLTGSGFEIAQFAEGSQAFANRDYVWRNVPETLRGWNYTRTRGGEAASIKVRALRELKLRAARAGSQARPDLDAWQKADWSFSYNDRGNTAMSVYTRTLNVGEEISLQQSDWTGTLLIFPPTKTSP